jgi:hypothetical protein
MAGRTTEMLKRAMAAEGRVIVVMQSQVMVDYGKRLVRDLGGDPERIAWLTPDTAERGLRGRHSDFVAVDHSCRLGACALELALLAKRIPS